MRLVVLALLCATPLARAQGGSAVMAVSVTVVNTCFFGAAARCARPGTSLAQASERVVATGERAVRQRVIHL